MVLFFARHAILYGSPLRWSALYRSLWYKFHIECLLNLKFNHCNEVLNHYLAAVSSELLAKAAVLKDMLLFRENSYLCISLFDTDAIAIAIQCTWTEW